MAKAPKAPLHVEAEVEEEDTGLDWLSEQAEKAVSTEKKGGILAKETDYVGNLIEKTKSQIEALQKVGLKWEDRNKWWEWSHSSDQFVTKIGYIPVPFLPIDVATGKPKLFPIGKTVGDAVKFYMDFIDRLHSSKKLQEIVIKHAKEQAEAKAAGRAKTKADKVAEALKDLEALKAEEAKAAAEAEAKAAAEADAKAQQDAEWEAAGSKQAT